MRRVIKRFIFGSTLLGQEPEISPDDSDDDISQDPRRYTLLGCVFFFPEHLRHSHLSHRDLFFFSDEGNLWRGVIVSLGRMLDVGVKF